MIVAGIDMGSLTTKVVILEGNNILAHHIHILISSKEGVIDAQKAIDGALRDAGLSFDLIQYIVSTGFDRKSVAFANKQRTEASCLAKGAHWLFPSARTVIDVGAETSTTLKLNEKGVVEDIQGNDKCAAGAGIFLDAMAELMQLSIEDFSRLSLNAKEKAKITNTCVVFAESEVISHIHKKPSVPKNDIIAGIHESIVERIIGLSARIGINKDVVLTGGVAKNIGFVKALEEKMGMKVSVPDEPQIVAALGAALIAQSYVSPRE